MATEYVSEGLRELLLELLQPVTVKQWSRMSGVVFEQCRHIFIAARRRGFIRCINPSAARHRLYFFTIEGLKAQNQLRHEQGLEAARRDIPDIDWDLYGKCCHTHRAAVIKMIKEPMQPCTIRRLAVRNDPTLKMSSGNVRDVIPWLKRQGLIRAVTEPKNPYFLYVLTDQGRHFQRLLKRAEVWL